MADSNLIRVSPGLSICQFSKPYQFVHSNTNHVFCHHDGSATSSVLSIDTADYVNVPGDGVDRSCIGSISLGLQCPPPVDTHHIVPRHQRLSLLLTSLVPY
jgi:hypothetical protein